MQLGTGSHSQQMVRAFGYHPSLPQSLRTGTNKNKLELSNFYPGTGSGIIHTTAFIFYFFIFS